MKRKRTETSYEQRRIEEIRPRKKRNTETYEGRILEIENEEVRNRITLTEETMTLKKKTNFEEEEHLVILWKYGEIRREEGKFKAEKFIRNNTNKEEV